MPDSMAGFVETYFSHIILGLLMCFGYVAWRVFNKPKAAGDGAPKGLEEALREAEAEARRAASARRDGADDVDGSGLALTPEQELEMAQIRRLARRTDPAPPTGNAEESQSGDEDK